MTIRPATAIPSNAACASQPPLAANDAPALPEHVRDRLLQGDLIEERRVARAQCVVCLLTAALVLARVAATYL